MENNRFESSQTPSGENNPKSENAQRIVQQLLSQLGSVDERLTQLKEKLDAGSSSEGLASVREDFTSKLNEFEQKIAQTNQDYANVHGLLEKFAQERSQSVSHLEQDLIALSDFESRLNEVDQRLRENAEDQKKWMEQYGQKEGVSIENEIDTSPFVQKEELSQIQKEWESYLAQSDKNQHKMMYEIQDRINAAVDVHAHEVKGEQSRIDRKIEKASALIEEISQRTQSIENQQGSQIGMDAFTQHGERLNQINTEMESRIGELQSELEASKGYSENLSQNTEAKIQMVLERLQEAQEQLQQKYQDLEVNQHQSDQRSDKFREEVSMDIAYRLDEAFAKLEIVKGEFEAWKTDLDSKDESLRKDLYREVNDSKDGYEDMRSRYLLLENQLEEAARSFKAEIHDVNLQMKQTTEDKNQWLKTQEEQKEKLDQRFQSMAGDMNQFQQKFSDQEKKSRDARQDIQLLSTGFQENRSMQKILNRVAALFMVSCLVVLIVLMSTGGSGEASALRERIADLEVKLEEVQRTSEDTAIASTSGQPTGFEEAHSLMTSDQDQNIEVRNLSGEVIADAIGQMDTQAEAETLEQQEVVTESVRTEEVSSESQFKEYVVKRGDKLWVISHDFYGAGIRYKKIMEDNNLEDENLKVGTVLKLYPL